MSSLEGVMSQVRGQWDSVTREIQGRVFGANNERLDLLMDTFNRLNEKQRSMAIGGAGLGIFLFISLAIALYLSSVTSLQKDLEDIKKLVETPELVEQLRDNLHTKISINYSINKITEDRRYLYLKLINKFQNKNKTELIS